MDTPENILLPEQRINEILEGGPTIFQTLEPSRLVELLSSPISLLELSEQINGTVPARWEAALLEDAEKYRPLPEMPKVDPLNRVSKKGRLKRGWLFPLALAASVLLNLVGAAYLAFRKHDDVGVTTNPGQKDNRDNQGNPKAMAVVASIKPSEQQRGGDDPKSLFIEANEPGFATFIVLRPEKPIKILPPHATTPFKVGESKSTPAEWGLNPKDFGPGAVLILVITRQPASGFLRESLSVGSYKPEHLESLRNRIETILTEHGFENPAVRVVDLSK